MKTVTVEEFVKAVTGSLVNVESVDHYGISLNITCARVQAVLLIVLASA